MGCGGTVVDDFVDEFGCAGAVHGVSVRSRAPMMVPSWRGARMVRSRPARWAPM